MYKKDSHYEFGPFRLDPGRRLLFRENQVVSLPPKVLQTLLVLVENSGRIVGKDELMKAVWPDTFVEEGNLTQNISMLRKVLGENPTEHTYIETVPKQGYRFIASDATKITPPPRLQRPTTLIWAALLSVGLTIAAGLGWYFGRQPNVAHSLAVTPLTSYPGLELHPSFAPDGNHVAFAWDGERQDNLDIYVKVVGSDRNLRLTFNAARDFRPAWSPDGRWIAFLREAAGGRASIMMIPATGGPERKVTNVDPGFFGSYDKAPYLEWTADGKWILTASRAGSDEASSVFLIAVDTGEKRRLTSPPPASLGDLTAAISSDGRTLVFSRSRSGTLGKICTLEMSGDFSAAGEPNCFAISEGRLSNFGSVRWTHDKREIVFSPLFRGRGGLWKMTLPARQGGIGVPQRFPIPSESGRDPAISRDRRRLVYSDFLVDADIWRLDLQDAALTKPGTTLAPVKLITSTKFDHAAEYSPDGRKIVFVSNRSGYPAVWVADSDGSNATQLTTFEAPLIGCPRWSPNGQYIVFDSTLEGQFELYVINADGGGLRRLTNHPAQDAVGSWSRDGQWIYFVSTRSGDHQIWKMRPDGSEPTQLTRNGGDGDISESVDRKFIYYAKIIAGNTSLWRTPVAGGEEVKVLDSLFRLQFAVTGSGVYFIAPTDYGSSIRFLNFQTGEVTSISPVDGPIQVGLSVSPDGRYLLYSFAKLIGGDLMLVENFQ